MKKTLTVFRREFLSLVGKPSFWFGLIVVPILVGVFVLIIALTSGAAAAASAAAKSSESTAQGVVDAAGLLRNQPAVLASQPNLKLFATEDEAAAALTEKTINSYYVVDAQFLANGAVRYVARQFSPIDTGDRSNDFEKTLRLALINGNDKVLERLDKPVRVQEELRVAPEEAGKKPEFSPVPIIAAVMFMSSLLGSSAYLMQSVSTEKENRVMEVLMSSVTPRQLLTGKILGLGLVGFLQMFMSLGSALLALPFLQRVPQLRPYLGVITAEAIGWSVLYFVLGYFIYASLMAGLGALMPAAKEASSYSFFVMLPLLVPVYLNASIVASPNSALSVALSLFPLSTPVAMTMRLLATTVPWWQPLLAAVLMLGGSVVTLRVVERLFRAQSLLRGTKPSAREVVAALRG